jgi:hypothetical protein
MAFYKSLMESGGGVDQSVVFFNQAHDFRSSSSSSPPGSVAVPKASQPSVADIRKHFDSVFQIWVAIYEEEYSNESGRFSDASEGKEENTRQAATHISATYSSSSSIAQKFDYPDGSDEDLVGAVKWIFSWRRAVCAFDEQDGSLRVVQQFAFSAPEYRGANITKVVMNGEWFEVVNDFV